MWTSQDRHKITPWEYPERTEPDGAEQRRGRRWLVACDAGSLKLCGHVIVHVNEVVVASPMLFVAVITP
jgi:hypothetical protein